MKKLSVTEAFTTNSIEHEGPTLIIHEDTLAAS